MKRILLLTLFSSGLLFHLSAQKSIRSFVFGHSLINHAFQVNPTPSQETSIPHWFSLLADASGHSYAVDGQFGFLPQHANVPPIAQWGFDLASGAWDSDNEPFSAADFDNIMITPGNFIQWQAPDENYPGEDFSPVFATNTIINWCKSQENDLDFFIYENWPDMSPFLANGFPPSAEEWSQYNQYLSGDFHNWFLDYFARIKASHPNECVRMIPSGPIIGKLLNSAPYNTIPLTALYEDDAPHGRPTIYFLAALTTYMAMYEEIAPPNFQPNNFIHPTIANNYQQVVDFIWQELNNFTDDADDNQAFCNQVISSTKPEPNSLALSYELFPNPTSNIVQLKTKDQIEAIVISDLLGNSLVSLVGDHLESRVIEIGFLPKGIYIINIKAKSGPLYFSRKLVKH